MIVLAGGGGNGGGGICAARHLANRRVKVGLCVADPAGLGDVPAFQRKVFQSTSGVEIDAAEIASEQPDLIIDALIGYGLRSGPHGAVARLIEWATASGAPILALDIPSGVNATTGERPGVWVHARWTLTLALPKTGITHACAGRSAVPRSIRRRCRRARRALPPRRSMAVADGAVHHGVSQRQPPQRNGAPTGGGVVAAASRPPDARRPWTGVGAVRRGSTAHAARLHCAGMERRRAPPGSTGNRGDEKREGWDQKSMNANRARQIAVPANAPVAMMSADVLNDSSEVSTVNGRALRSTAETWP